MKFMSAMNKGTRVGDGQKQKLCYGGGRIMVAIVLLLSCKTMKADEALPASGPRRIELSRNLTQIPIPLIQAFNDKVVNAVATHNEPGLRAIMHPNCVQALQTNEDARLFLKYLLSQKIPTNYTWKAAALTNSSSGIFKINRFIVKPEVGIDLMWKQKGPDSKETLEGLTLCVAKKGDALYFVTYMNDYLAEEVKTADKATSGKRK
jgi:hypothetical protein